MRLNILKKHLSYLILFYTFISMPALAKQPIICKNTYALCNAASCQSIPGINNKLICFCSVWKGANIGFSKCSERKESQTQDKDTTLLSTFSFGGGHYKYMTCPSGGSWANCLDHPCLLDKNSPDKRRAFCTCDIERNKPFVTFAGDCQKDNCNKEIWSGASIEGNRLLMDQLMKRSSKQVNQASCPKADKS